MNDFRGPLSLRDRDFAEVRAKVLSTIERRPRGGFVFRSALAATAAALLVLLVVPRRATVPAKSLSHRTVRAVATPRPAPAPVVTEAPPSKQPDEPAAETKACACEVTMNIETADPDVRIIWIGR